MKPVRCLTLLVAMISLAFLLPGQSGSTAAKKAPETKSADAKSAKTAKAEASGAAQLVDINRATPAELRALPGIGEAYSAAIVRNRPYKNKTQLRSKNVIPPATYEKIKDLIIAKQ